MSLVPTVDLMNQMCRALTDMERAGVCIDTVALEKLSDDYTVERDTLRVELQLLAEEALGDTPININSPAQLSALIYSRSVNDKHDWADTFNLGTEMRGGTRKPKTPTRMRHAIWKRHVAGMTTIIRRTSAHQCPDCKGTGKLKMFKNNGEVSKQVRNCKKCKATGIIYTENGQIGGFKQKPKDIYDLTTNGFATDKVTLERLASNATGNAKEFLTKMVRYNAVEHYLSNFIDGIRRNVRGTGLLHTNFNQCIARTGRLSSSAPNFHNQPRGNTFPIRAVIVSRFEEGLITEADYGQLEFRVAAELSGDRVALQDILDGRDAHAYTATTLTEGGQVTDRQGAKCHTFKPLYGGTSGTEAERTYYTAFLERYEGIRAWHDALCATAVRGDPIVLPSGREYSFPYTRRFPSGGVSNGTQIKNYPVQGFATGDIVPISTILIWEELRKYKLKSLLINEVHDSNVVDTHPDEAEQVVNIMGECMLGVTQELKDRYSYTLTVPLSVEIKQGINWLDMDVVYEGTM